MVTSRQRWREKWSWTTNNKPKRERERSRPIKACACNRRAPLRLVVVVLFVPAPAQHPSSSAPPPPTIFRPPLSAVHLSRHRHPQRQADTSFASIFLFPLRRCLNRFQPASHPSEPHMHLHALEPHPSGPAKVMERHDPPCLTILSFSIILLLFLRLHYSLTPPPLNQVASRKCRLAPFSPSLPLPLSLCLHAPKDVVETLVGLFHSINKAISFRRHSLTVHFCSSHLATFTEGISTARQKTSAHQMTVGMQNKEPRTKPALYQYPSTPVTR